MKRCSQCDFIYEDDQHLCDMDGHELVYEPTLNPVQLDIATKPLPRSATAGARRQALAAGVAVLIAIVLSVGYSALTRESAPQHTKAPATEVIPAPPPQPDQPAPTPAVSPTPSPSLEKTRVSPSSKSPIALSTPRLSDSRRERIRPQPARANHKKESRIGGFLKKTGNLLKKPFKKL